MKETGTDDWNERLKINREFQNKLANVYPNTCGLNFPEPERSQREIWDFFQYGPRCGAGWWPLLEEFCKEVEYFYEIYGVGCFIAQFKEKFGHPNINVQFFCKEKYLHDNEYNKIYVEAGKAYIKNVVDKYTYKMSCVSEMDSELFSDPKRKFSDSFWVRGYDCKNAVKIFEKKLADAKSDQDKKYYIEKIKQAEEADLIYEMKEKISYSWGRLSLDELRALYDNVEAALKAKESKEKK